MRNRWAVPLPAELYDEVLDHKTRLLMWRRERDRHHLKAITEDAPIGRRLVRDIEEGRKITKISQRMWLTIRARMALHIHCAERAAELDIHMTCSRYGVHHNTLRNWFRKLPTVHRSLSVEDLPDFGNVRSGALQRRS